ncbi:hypothetical protein [Micromonospora fulviviridis]|uniref:Uncharacterized protein n=1 Tax=Micromonospora fulviviridis TaxID=47860 RepID=A0ABV2VN37_9ACTN
MIDTDPEVHPTGVKQASGSCQEDLRELPIRHRIRTAPADPPEVSR